MNYILNESGHPVPVLDLLEWARWFETAERHVGDDTLGAVHVSTIFLGIDHAFGIGPPVLWETMIFGGEHDQFQERYCTREDAIAGHVRAVALVGKI